MPTRSRPQIALVATIVVLAVFHLASVTMASLPTNRASDKVQPATSYLGSYFAQNWRLFAPNPISDDRSVGFRGEYVGADGKPATTPWLNWTDVELDLVRHQIVGGRAGYITNKMLGSLNSRFLALELSQREIALNDRETALKGYQALQDRLLADKGNPQRVALYLRYETSIVRLATAALEARHPETDFTAVRYRIVRQSVASYNNRTLPDAAREESRADPVIRRSGWRKPIQPSAAESRTIADFLARHR